MVKHVINVENVTLDRVHRMGTKAAGRQRAIVAKFNSSKGKEEVLKHARNLADKHQYQIYEQLPAEVNEKRRRPMDKYKQARRNKDNRVSWQLDKLVINGTVYRADDVKHAITAADAEGVKDFQMYHTSHSTKEGSTFQGHVAIVKNTKEILATIAHLLEDQAMAKAACNSFAYRLKKETRSNKT